MADGTTGVANPKGPPPVRRPRYLPFLRRNLRFLAFGFSLTLFSGFGQTYFISTLSPDIKASFGFDAWNWGLCYAIATVAAGCTLIQVGKRLDTTDLRRWTSSVLLAVSCACLVMWQAVNVPLLILGLFAVRFTGQGLMGHTSSTSMARYFKAERGLALTLSGLGFAVGFGVFPRLGRALVGVLDWHDVWLVLAGVALFVAWPLTRFLLRGHTARHAAWEASIASDERAAIPDDNEDGGGRHWTRAEVVRDWRLYAMLPGALACPCLMTGMIFFHEDLGAAKGWSLDYISEAMWIMGVVMYATSVTLGPMVDRIGARRLIGWTQVPLLGSMLLLATLSHPLAVYGYLGLAGMTMGSMGPVFGSIWPELYGTKHLGSIRALTTAAMSVSTASPMLFGAWISAGVPMYVIATGAACYVAFAIVLLVLAMRVRPARQRA